MPDRHDVKRLLAASAEVKAGVDPAEWTALEAVLGHVHDDAVRIPDDPAERDALALAFNRIGWGVGPAPKAEE